MTEIYDDIETVKELQGGIARVDESGEVFLDMPDGKVFQLKGTHNYRYDQSFVDATRVK